MATLPQYLSSLQWANQFIAEHVTRSTCSSDQKSVVPALVSTRNLHGLDEEIIGMAGANLNLPMFSVGN